MQLQTNSRPHHSETPQPKLPYVKCTRLNTKEWNNKLKRVALANKYFKTNNFFRFRDTMNASGVIVGPPNGTSTPSGSTSSTGREDTKLSYNKNWLTKFLLLHSVWCSPFCKASVFRFRIHWVRIWIQHFRLKIDPDPDTIQIQGFDDQKLKKKNYSWKKSDIFSIKIAIYLSVSLGLHKRVKATGEAFSPQKRTSSNSKHEISWCFPGNFCPPGSGSRFRIRVHWPDWIRIPSGSKTLHRMFTFYLIIEMIS